MPELYKHLNPMPFDAAAQMEKELAEDLRKMIYTDRWNVNCHRRFDITILGFNISK